jgi:hypothetical protein
MFSQNDCIQFCLVLQDRFSANTLCQGPGGNSYCIFCLGSFNNLPSDKARVQYSFSDQNGRTIMLVNEQFFFFFFLNKSLNNYKLTK